MRAFITLLLVTISACAQTVPPSEEKADAVVTNSGIDPCHPSWYGDRECDCGCATPDPDCAEALLCDYCWTWDGDCSDEPRQPSDTICRLSGGACFAEVSCPSGWRAPDREFPHECGFGSTDVCCIPGDSTLCTDSCPFDVTNVCDDGGEGATNDFCQRGTDCDDCGPRPR